MKMTVYYMCNMNFSRFIVHWSIEKTVQAEKM